MLIAHDDLQHCALWFLSKYLPVLWVVTTVHQAGVPIPSAFRVTHDRNKSSRQRQRSQIIAHKVHSCLFLLRSWEFSHSLVMERQVGWAATVGSVTNSFSLPTGSSSSVVAWGCCVPLPSGVWSTQKGSLVSLCLHDGAKPWCFLSLHLPHALWQILILYISISKYILASVLYGIIYLVFFSYVFSWHLGYFLQKQEKKMYSITCYWEDDGSCGFEFTVNERLRRWQKEVKGRNNAVLMDITKLGQLPLIESLLPEEIENRKRFGENPTLRQLYLQNTVFVNTEPQLLFLDIRILWKEKQKSWKVT